MPQWPSSDPGDLSPHTAQPDGQGVAAVLGMSRRTPASVPYDAINPAHYRDHPSGVDCIQIVRHMNFNLGNTVKYIWRAGQKGDAVEDLRKAAWYLADEIKRLGG